MEPTPAPTSDRAGLAFSAYGGAELGAARPVTSTSFTQSEVLTAERAQLIELCFKRGYLRCQESVHTTQLARIDHSLNLGLATWSPLIAHDAAKRLDLEQSLRHSYE